MKVSRCKSERCRAPIIWCDTEHGKKMPLDEHPVAAESKGSQFTIEYTDGSGRERETPLAVYAPPASRLSARELHFSHWATCPDRGNFSRKGR